MNRREDAEYARRLEARETRRREIDEAAGTTHVSATASINPPRKRKNRKRRQRNTPAEPWSSRNEYGNTVIRPWRRNNSGGWSRS